MRSFKDEIFKQYNDKYLISNYGRVFSLKTFKFLVPMKNNKGYLRVDLQDEPHKHKLIFIHLMVVNVFGDCNGKIFEEAENFECLTVDHLDKNKNNCRQDNLEIVTHKENCRRKRLENIQLQKLKESRKITLMNEFTY